MSTTREPCSCSLHVLVAGPHDLATPDVSALVAAVRGRLRQVTVAAWTDGDDLDLSAVERAAVLADELEVLTRRRPRYLELVCSPGAAVERLLSVSPGTTAIVTMGAGSPRQLVSAARCAAEHGRAHVALLPGAPDPETETAR